MMSKTKRYNLIVILFIGLLFSACNTSHDAMIGDDMAVFYPDDFEADLVLPSMSLLKEPVAQGRISSNWELKPVFFKNDSNKNCISISLPADVDLYGTGEVTGPLNRKNEHTVLWNTDNKAFEVHNGKRLYQSHPWIMGVRKDGSSFGILIDNTWKQSITLSNPIEIVTDGPACRVIVIERESPQELVKTLADLTGKMELPPLWSLGYQQCRYSYFPDSRVKEIADGFRNRNIPCDVIWMDIHYMQDFKIFTFDSIGFPNPKEVNDYLHSKNMKGVWMIDPGVKKEEGYFVYDQGTEGDHWVKTADGEEYNGKVWPGDCAFPDFTRPETRKWWGSLYKDYMAMGVDGVWNDMNEPAVFDGPDMTMPIDNMHRGGDGLPAGSHLRYHNVYGMLMAKASKEGILAANPNKRPFVLSRANYLGGQKYAATWTGDNVASWEHLKMSIPMSLNIGLSGQPFSGPDIGGFLENATPELFGHWIATGAFYPFSRAHTIRRTDDQEPWAFGKEIENVSRIALQRRYRLMPYLYTLFQEASETGLPVMRPIFFADAKDTRLRNEDQAFLWGEDLMIVPKWAVDPKLPKGIWRNLSIVGEESINDKYQPDLKIKGGAIIPLCNRIESTTEYRTDSLTLMVCLDEQQKATGKLYNDKGDGFEYQSGYYSLDEFTVNQLSKEKFELKIVRKEGSLDQENTFYRLGIVGEKGTYYSNWQFGDTINFVLKDLE